MRKPVALLLTVMAILTACGQEAAERGEGSRPDRGSESLLPSDRLALPQYDLATFRSLLTELRGTPVVVNVWGSWCPGCIAEAEDLRRFAADHPEVQLIGVDLQDTRGAAREFYARWRWTHPSVFDPDGEISFSLGLQGTPSTFFLDRQHRIVSRIVGETDYAGFERGLEAAVAQS